MRIFAPRTVASPSITAVCTKPTGACWEWPSLSGWMWGGVVGDVDLTVRADVEGLDGRRAGLDRGGGVLLRRRAGLARH
ncbi:MAG: hypothetical protein HC888_06085, partial [Candidatus Competibacteraceae bacterium]|nr:hypothetical protein [Candidatus Competibacteraceae bacterium]